MEMSAHILPLFCDSFNLLGLADILLYILGWQGTYVPGALRGLCPPPKVASFPLHTGLVRSWCLSPGCVLSPWC